MLAVASEADGCRYIQWQWGDHTCTVLVMT